ncbi:MAG: hypothetical protein IAE79_02060 [Anaerolinea sp.]|nr:hypothetical protein [Anaerolinea sp.]
MLIRTDKEAGTRIGVACSLVSNGYLVFRAEDADIWARPFLSTGTPLNPAFAVSTANGITPAAQPPNRPLPASPAAAPSRWPGTHPALRRYFSKWLFSHIMGHREK